MRAHPVVVHDVFVQHTQQMLFVQHDDVVETFPPQGPDDALRDGIRVRCVHRRHDRRDPDVRCALDEVIAVTAVMVANEVARCLSPRRGLDDRQIHWAVGCCVTLTWTIRLRPWAMKTIAYSVRSVSVCTVKRSTAQISGGVVTQERAPGL